LCSATLIEVILPVSRRPRWPRQVKKATQYFGHYPAKLRQCKHGFNGATTFGITTFSVKTLGKTKQHKGSQHNDAQQLTLSITTMNS
jgi:hypothetical protein